MNVQLLVTENDFSLPNLKSELMDLGVGFDVFFIEENPDLVSAFNIRHSPNIFIDGRLAFRYQPTEKELKEYLKGAF